MTDAFALGASVAGTSLGKGFFSLKKPEMQAAQAALQRTVMSKPRKFVYASGRLRQKNQGEREYHVQKKQHGIKRVDVGKYQSSNSNLAYF